MIKKLVPVFVLLLFFAYTHPGDALESKPDSDSVSVSLKLNNSPLGEVAKDIYEKTGYHIIFDEEKWSSLPISGNYENVSLDDFFRRVFRKQNTSLLINDKDRIYVIRFFGDKSFKDLLSTASIVSRGGEEALSGEYQEQFDAARAEMQQLLNDPETVDPVSELTLGQIRQIHINAQEEKGLLLANPDSVDPASGLNVAEINEQNRAARSEIDKTMNDPESVDPVSGLSRRDIKRINSSAQAEKEQILNNPDSVDPVTGLTISEIRAKAGK